MRALLLVICGSFISLTAHTQTISTKASSSEPSPTRHVSTTLPSPTTSVVGINQMIAWQQRAKTIADKSNARPLTLKTDMAPPPSPPVTSILPVGVHSYMYYPAVETYYSERFKTFYYLQEGKWVARAEAPAHQSLGVGQPVYLQGESTSARDVYFGKAQQPKQRM